MPQPALCPLLALPKAGTGPSLLAAASSPDLLAALAQSLESHLSFLAHFGVTKLMGLPGTNPTCLRSTGTWSCPVCSANHHTPGLWSGFHSMAWTGVQAQRGAFPDARPPCARVPSLVQGSSDPSLSCPLRGCDTSGAGNSEAYATGGQQSLGGGGASVALSL